MSRLPGLAASGLGDVTGYAPGRWLAGVPGGWWQAALMGWAELGQQRWAGRSGAEWISSIAAVTMTGGGVT